MEQANNLQNTKKGPSVPAIPSVERRMFLRQMGLFTATTALLASCTLEDHRVVEPGVIDLGPGDIGISNLAYMLDQLEVAFYHTALEKAMNVTAADKKMIAELHDHEIMHKEFFKAFLGPNAIPMLDFDFSSINFNSREGVFGAAQEFENVGVGAFNGTGPLIQNVEVLKIAGKMVSIEARHATLARHMLQPRSTYTLAPDIVNDQGLDWALTPDDVVSRAQKFIKQRISAANLPK